MRAALLLFAACQGPDPAGLGANEAMTVRDATYFAGEMPENPDAAEPEIRYAGGVSAVVTQGQGNVQIKGVASEQTYSVALTFPSVSQGYWVIPTDGADVTDDNAQLFSATVDFTPEVPYGLQSIALVAFDGEGRVGPRYTSDLCILPESAHGDLSACTDEVLPQNAILSLAWDTAVDLDLMVLTPDGKLVSPKSPTTAAVEGEVPDEILEDESTGTLSRDSNKNCVIDNINLESLVFPGEPPPGTYTVYASLYSDCGQSYVNFDLSLIRRVEGTGEEAGTWPVSREPLAQGQLLAQSADAGATRGTRIATVTFP